MLFFYFFTSISCQITVSKKAKTKIKEGEAEIAGEEAPADQIAASSTDDMFAFSQIVASGEKVSEITNEMMKASKKEPE